MPQLTMRQLSLVVALVGVLSVALHEPLSRLDLLGSRGSAPHWVREERLRQARRIILGAGIGCIVLAGLLVRIG